MFLGAERMPHLQGLRVMTVFERLMGFILTAMAVEMPLAGIREYVNSL